MGAEKHISSGLLSLKAGTRVRNFFQYTPEGHFRDHDLEPILAAARSALDPFVPKVLKIGRACGAKWTTMASKWSKVLKITLASSTVPSPIPYSSIHSTPTVPSTVSHSSIRRVHSPSTGHSTLLITCKDTTNTGHQDIPFGMSILLEYGFHKEHTPEDSCLFYIF